MNPTLLAYYRLPEDLCNGINSLSFSESDTPGFFRFGAKTICYGKCQIGVSKKIAGSERFDALAGLSTKGPRIQLPFDFSEVVENLRLERYREMAVPEKSALITSAAVRKLYYFLREFLPVSVRRHLQRLYFQGWEELPFPAWPLDCTVDTLHEKYLRLVMDANGLSRLPFIWFWPDSAPACLVLTHDVETPVGRDFTDKLMDLDDSRGFKASFQVVPEKRYAVSDDYVSRIKSRGFEVNVHDLNHDGNLYQSHAMFMERAKRINEYSKKFGALGFRAGVMYRNLGWYEAFQFSYDMSVPNVAHLEPQRGGCCTVFPYFIGKILEIPLTTSQDYSVFQILNDYSIDLWKTQLELIRKRNGLMSFITHPDYLIDARPRKVYESLLDYLRETVVRDKIWPALPGELDHWWRARSQMKLVRKGEGWQVEGPESNRASVAFAVADGDGVSYEFAASHDREGVPH